MLPTPLTNFKREIARVALERRARADLNNRAVDSVIAGVRRASPAMDAAVAAVEASARRSVIKLMKSRARDYLNPKKAWQLDMIWDGLSGMCPGEALRILDRAALLPSYQNRTSIVNIRAARLAFRLVRRRQRTEEYV